MDSFETYFDADSSKTVILWRNNVSCVDLAPSAVSLLENHHQHRGHSYKVLTGLGEHFLNSVIKTSEDEVNEVIADSKRAVQCYLKMDKFKLANSGYNGENMMINDNAIQACKDICRGLDSNHLLFPNPSWLNDYGMFEDQVAIANISSYIKHHWDLDAKYLYTVDKWSSPKISDSTCHGYKAEFSVSTNEYPIPQVTVSAFFTVSVTPLLSLPAVYIKYQLETDRHVYVVGRHSFNKNHFERLFKTKRYAYMDINRYFGWSSGLNS